MLSDFPEQNNAPLADGQKRREQNRLSRSQGFFCIFSLFFCFAYPIQASGDTSTILKRFSHSRHLNAIPQGWQEISFPTVSKGTKYQILEIEGRRALQASTAGGASLLGMPINISLQKYPLLTWSWRIEEHLKNCDLKSKSGDDAPARLLLSFGDSLRSPAPAISYVWSSTFSKGQIIRSPYEKEICTYSLRDLSSKEKIWKRESRVVATDFLRCFGKPPSSPVKGIALLSDGDNTNQLVTAFYGDIQFQSTIVTTDVYD